MDDLVINRYIDCCILPEWRQCVVRGLRGLHRAQKWIFMHMLCATIHTCRELNIFMDSKSDDSDKLEACNIDSPLSMPWTILMTAQSAPYP